MTNLLKAETSALPAYSLRTSLPDQVIERPANEAQPRALLIDDDDLYREALKGELVEAGFDIADFPDKHAALDSLSQGQAATSSCSTGRCRPCRASTSCAS